MSGRERATALAFGLEQNEHEIRCHERGQASPEELYRMPTADASGRLWRSEPNRIVDGDMGDLAGASLGSRSRV